MLKLEGDRPLLYVVFVVLYVEVIMIVTDRVFYYGFRNTSRIALPPVDPHFFELGIAAVTG